MLRRIISAVVLCSILFLVAWLMVCFVARARMAESAVECKHRMKLIGDGIRDYADTRAGRFPTATVRSKELPAEERLSWYAEIWPYLIQTQLKLEKDKAWY